jgi:hypothetical protein
LLSVIGATLMVIALAMRAISHDPPALKASAVLAALGGVFVLLVPVMLGGGMMRAASSRIILHQRPWGRQRMLLGATLAITLIAICGTLLVTAVEELQRQNGSLQHALEVFALAWSLVATTWVCVFIAAGNRLLSFLFGFVPLAIARYGTAVFGEMPDARLLVVMSVILWTCFSFWYLRAGQIARLVYGKAGREELYNSRINRFFQWAAGAGRRASRARATEAHLLGMSPMGSFVTGVYFVVVGALLYFMFTIFTGHLKNAPLQFLAPFYLLPVVVLCWAVMGYALSRRVRVLWLRAGLDRLGLFREVERSGLLVGLVGIGVFLIALLLYALAKWPANKETILIFVAVQVPCVACFFYGGMSFTQRWAAMDTLIATGLCALLAAQILLLRPWSGEPRPVAPFVLGTVLALAPILRWHARRRWLSLDWRVARVAQLPLRG